MKLKRKKKNADGRKDGRNKFGLWEKGKSANPRGRTPGRKKRKGHTEVNVNYWLKKRLQGPPSKKGKRFETLSEELADILVSKAMKSGNIQWLKTLLSRTDDPKLTRTRMFDIIEFIYIIVSKYVDEKDRDAIYQEFKKKLRRFNPLQDEEEYF